MAARFAQVVPRKCHVGLPLLIMAALYGLSSLPGVPLPADPGRYALLQWVPPEVQNAMHLPAYAALSWAWNWALAGWLRAPAGRGAGAWFIASAYGVLDEWHQSFVPGRYASLTDVVLNILGAAVGIWIAARAASRSRALEAGGEG